LTSSRSRVRIGDFTSDNILISLSQGLSLGPEVSYFPNLMIFRQAAHTADITPPAKPEGYCDALKVLIKAGDTQFSELMGKKFGKNGARSKMTPANWNSCVIHSFSNSNSNNKERKYVTCAHARPTSRRRSKPPTAAAAAKWRRRQASISHAWTIRIGSALRPWPVVRQASVRRPAKNGLLP
jgi:hypothetical protein